MCSRGRLLRGPVLAPSRGRDRLRPRLAPHIAMGVLVIGSVAVAYMTLTASLAAPGWAVDPATHVPVGTAFPGYVRVLTGPFNIAD